MLFSPLHLTLVESDHDHDLGQVAMTREKFPEKIPFRLTRMLTNAMEVTPPLPPVIESVGQKCFPVLLLLLLE